MSPLPIVLIAAVLVIAAVAAAARPRSARTWLTAWVAVGGSLAFLPAVAVGDEPLREVARLFALVGAMALLHESALLVGWRRPAEGEERPSLAVPLSLYAAVFASWIGLELAYDSLAGLPVVTWVFGAAAVIAAGILVVHVASAGSNAPTAVRWSLPGLLLVAGSAAASGWGGAHATSLGLGALLVLILGLSIDFLPRRSPKVAEESRSAAADSAPAPAAAPQMSIPDLSSLGRVEGEEDLVRWVGEAAAERGAVLLGLLFARPDDSLDDLVRSETPLASIDPADPLYVALRAGRHVVRDGLPSVRADRAPARAAVHRLTNLGADLAVSTTLGEQWVGGALFSWRGEPRSVAFVGELASLGVPVGLAFAAMKAGQVAREKASTNGREATFDDVEVALDAVGPTGDVEHGVVGQSEAVRVIRHQIDRVAASDAAVFVRGETGTGKEKVVAAIHRASGRSERPLVKIPCAALPENLLESELFGYEPGAFTGAVERKEGRFEVADGGTLFFDDVDTLPLGVQAKLLRALQEGEVQRLGSNHVRHVDVRVVSATNRDLLADVRAGTFREDLYYRLNVVPIDLPPLRDRKDDIPLLIEHFLESDGRAAGHFVDGLAAGCLEALIAYDWPGNVRELRNVIQRALVLNGERLLQVAPPEPGSDGARRAAEDGLGRASLPELLRRYKTSLVAEALERSGGNQRKAAELLGIHRPSLTRMLRELGLRDAVPGKRSKAK